MCRLDDDTFHLQQAEVLQTQLAPHRQLLPHVQPPMYPIVNKILKLVSTIKAFNLNITWSRALASLSL